MKSCNTQFSGLFIEGFAQVFENVPAADWLDNGQLVWYFSVLCGLVRPCATGVDPVTTVPSVVDNMHR